MRNRKKSLSLVAFASILIAVFLLSRGESVSSQQRDVQSRGNYNAEDEPSKPQASPDVVKIEIDLVKIDALVLQKNTARVVGGLKKEDFLISEDGTRQEITHFSQDKLPLSVLLVVDRGACVDPFVDEVHSAAREAIDQLKPVDEIAIMAYANTTVLVQSFTRNRILIENALNRMPPQAGNVEHCMNNMFADAADYMIKASNPAGRRVVIVLTGVTRRFDCPDAPPGKSAAQAIYESGSVVCGILPKVPTQGIEERVVTMGTRVMKVTGMDYMDIQTLANETGGEVLSDKPEILETTFQTLIDHLRSRYNLAFVSTNRKRDGTTRKLRVDLTPATQKSQGKLVIKARRSYVAPRK
jgi:VWFA-related protein